MCSMATRFKMGMHLWNRSTETIQVFLMNSQPIKATLPYHKIDCYALHTSTARKNRFSKKKIKCVTRLDLSGVPKY